jgi:hypothetical protein
MTASDPQSVRKTRWYSPTVGKFLFAILASQVVLYLSQHFKWFAFNQLKGHSVVITVTATTIGLLLIAGVLVLGRRAQFTLATLMLMVPVMAIPCSWLVREMNQARRQSQIVAGCEPYLFELQHSIARFGGSQMVRTDLREGSLWRRE